ncbi:MarR family winged helix-turn-helix transcriptional regulator [Amycolatopsis minnesotensis]|uniref:HTH marR-type domain-containing protein n=1 Tax=Amycolatopsis minnesotensis TaxID=337894 RepID=A0ABN2SN30_9PSEU
MDEYRELMRYLHRAALLSERAGERRFTERIGIGRTQFLVLRTISDAAETPSQQAIADLLSLTKGAVSRHVANARREGWLTIGSSPVSRRENALELTSAGRALVERGRAVQVEYEELSRPHLSKRDVVTTGRTLKTLCELLEQEERR